MATTPAFPSPQDPRPQDPFRVLLQRRAKADATLAANPDWPSGKKEKFAADARKDAVSEAQTSIFKLARKYARFAWQRQGIDEDVAQDFDCKLIENEFCERVYDGVRPAPPKGLPFIKTSVINMGISALTPRGRMGICEAPMGKKITATPIDKPLQGDKTLGDIVLPNQPASTDFVVDRDLQRWKLRRISMMAADELCAFHPGRRCEHVSKGRAPENCAYKAFVLRSIILGVRNGHDAAEIANVTMIRSGHDLGDPTNWERKVYRCIAWFEFRAFYQDDHPTIPTNLALIARISTRLNGLTGQQPSSATCCLLMNKYSKVITVPEDLRSKYAGHLDGSSEEIQ